MHNRLDEVFARCRKQQRAALVGYLTAGDPNPDTSAKLLDGLAGHVDIIEIGMPFSDPMADGPVIQAASERALAAGTHMSDVFNLVQHINDRHPETAIVLMGYANTPYAMGVEHFARQARMSGADGVLIVDLPPEEEDLLHTPLQQAGLHQIFLLAPTSSEKRIRLASEKATGFIYYVSLTGITGAEMGALDGVRKQCERIRHHANLPICVGFGIKTPEQARAVSEFADGVVVGSAFVAEIAGHAHDAAETLRARVVEKAKAIRQALEGHHGQR
ncbi:MAG: tryptophan synthase subunit alpha [Zetaproteobacteria bacterium]|nr:MAG: tryptophan synthase subunit alpha [Zetaproteobacteria bacterium]